VESLLGVQEVPSSNLGGPTSLFNNLPPFFIATFPHNSRKSKTATALFSICEGCVCKRFLVGVQEVPSSNLGGPTKFLNLSNLHQQEGFGVQLESKMDASATWTEIDAIAVLLMFV